MNTGVQDAFNLGWKLALVHRGLSPSSLLETYDEERLPVIAEMLNQTTQLLKQNFHLKVAPSESLTRTGADSLSQLGVNYRWSRIVVDERKRDGGMYESEEARSCALDSYGLQGGAIRAGDRAPDASCLQLLHSDSPLVQCGRNGEQLTLFDVFGPSHHTVLIFTDDSERCLRIQRARERYPQFQAYIRTVNIPRSGPCTRMVDITLEDTNGSAYKAYHECDVVVVRPDGFIGAIVKDTDGLERYFTQMFCKPYT